MFDNFMGGLASGGVSGGGVNILSPAGNGLSHHDVFDFCSDEFFPEMDFGVEFSFGGDSFLPEIEVDFFENTSFHGEDFLAYDDVSISHSVESIVSIGSPGEMGRKRKRKKRSPNRTSYRASVRTSCWYKNYLEPGQVRETTHICYQVPTDMVNFVTFFECHFTR